VDGQIRPRPRARDCALWIFRWDFVKAMMLFSGITTPPRAAYSVQWYGNYVHVTIFIHWTFSPYYFIAKEWGD